MFFKKKIPNKAMWAVYRGYINDGEEMSVRVDTRYVKAKYAHTYYIQIRYSEGPTTELPDAEFMQQVGQLEDTVEEALNRTTDGKIVYLGCATFGGSAYLTYASDYNVKWLEMLSSLLNISFDGEVFGGGVYLNDRMGYYNQVLYPDAVRRHGK